MVSLSSLRSPGFSFHLCKSRTPILFASKDTGTITEPRKLEENAVPKSHVAFSDNLLPLVAALKASAQENVASFHCPGHNRSRATPSSLVQLIGPRLFSHDLPELPELEPG